jgi:hypothetical protein
VWRSGVKGGGGGLAQWRFEVAANSGGRWWPEASPGARGGRERDEPGRN